MIDGVARPAPSNIRDREQAATYRLRARGRQRASDAAAVTIAERDAELFAGLVTEVRLDRASAP
jgi:hypothetical protein